MTLWVVYIGFACITHLITLNRFMHNQDPAAKSYRQSLYEFYLGNLTAELVTVGTFVTVWLLGALYISKISFLIGNELRDLPPHPAIAAFLGFAGEWAAPKAIKFFLGLIIRDGG